jgi:1,3-beta-glucanosyltransferase GAS3
LKDYIAKHSTRHIPVGYSAADVRTVLEDTWNYLRCDLGDGDTSAVEMFGLNSYSWCGAQATYTSAGYNQIVAIFQGTNIPVFFSEYGCNQPAGVPRVFNEVASLYGANMTSLNGGLVYQWSEDTSDYGLVQINGDGSITLRQDFNNLQAQYNKLDKTLITKIPNPNTNTDPACTAALLTSGSLPTNWTIPPIPAAAATYITNGVPNAINGKIVPITNTVPNVKIYDVNNISISGLQLETITSGSNSPSGANTTSGQAPSSGQSSTGAQGSASPNGGKKGAASAVQVTSGLALAAVALTMIFAF